MSVVSSFFLRYSNIDFVSGRFFFSLRKISMAVKFFVLNGVVNSFSSFPCVRVSGVIDNLYKARLMSLSVVDCHIFKLVIF